MFAPIPLCQIGNKCPPKWRHNMASWIGHLSGFMKYVEFSYNHIESRIKIEKRDFFMYFWRCLNGNSFTSRERLQPIRILRNVSLKKNTERSRKGPPDLPRGRLPPGPSSPFPQRRVCYDKDVILRRICTYAVQLSAIWRSLLGSQTRAFSSYFR